MPGSRKKTGTAPTASVPASVVNELFPENDPSDAPAVLSHRSENPVQNAPGVAVDIPAPVPTPETLGALNPSSGRDDEDDGDDAANNAPVISVPPDEAPLPIPVLKPTRY